eukprot:jgi/Chlat1/2305/Chrsp17S00167
MRWGRGFPRNASHPILNGFTEDEKPSHRPEQNGNHALPLRLDKRARGHSVRGSACVQIAFASILLCAMLLFFAVSITFQRLTITVPRPGPTVQTFKSSFVDHHAGARGVSAVLKGDEHLELDESLDEHAGFDLHPSRALKADDLASYSASYRDTQAVCSRHWAKGLESLVGAELQSWSVFFAMNLHQNQEVSPHLATELLRVISWLDPGKVFVSVYESGSTDKTAEVISGLHSLLDKRRVSHLIVSNSTDMRAEGAPRIEFLARVRNRALDPLFDLAHHMRFDKVFFNNDVFFCAEDVLLLLLHDAHIAAGLDINKIDWKRRKGPVYYDIWVGQDLNGDDINRFPPYVRLSESQARFQQGLPVSVYCAWNGMVSIRPEVFYDQQTRFRTRKWRGECSASEMTFFCQDIWKAYGLNTRVVIDPRVLVAYKPAVFADIDLARQKRVPSKYGSKPFDIGIAPNPWKSYFQSGEQYLHSVIKSIKDVPAPSTIPPLLQCCPLPDGATNCVGEAQCHWEPVHSGRMLAADPAQGTQQSCPAAVRWTDKDTVFVALTLAGHVPIPSTFYRQMEALGLALGRAAFISVVVLGEEEWPPWRAQLANVFMSLDVRLKHRWIHSPNGPLIADSALALEAARAHWHNLKQLKGRVVGLAVNPHVPICASEVVAHARVAGPQRAPCDEAYFDRIRATTCHYESKFRGACIDDSLWLHMQVVEHGTLFYLMWLLLAFLVLVGGALVLVWWWVRRGHLPRLNRLATLQVPFIRMLRQ